MDIRRDMLLSGMEMLLTEWSNNQLEMWVVDNLKDLELKQWLQYTSHEEPPTGEIGTCDRQG